MDDYLALASAAQLKATVAEVVSLNSVTGVCGLSLDPSQARRLAEARLEALADAGRVELGGGILGQLICAFYDSPYITQENYEVTLGELQELFYALKNELNISDPELLSAMRRVFDGEAGGSTDYLAGLSPDELISGGRREL